jgi:hypothetical protein
MGPHTGTACVKSCNLKAAKVSLRSEGGASAVRVAILCIETLVGVFACIVCKGCDVRTEHWQYECGQE